MTYCGVEKGSFEVSRGRLYYSLYPSPVALAADAPTWERSGNTRFYGRDSLAEVVRKCSEGDLGLVAESERFMRELEDEQVLSPRRQWQLDLAGHVPNVPAFLAGNPASMRRRRRIETESAPLVIVADLTSSAGVGADDLARRGVAVLSLVRLLTAKRAVTLYTGAGTCQAFGQHGCHVLCRVETTPLDLATTMHVTGNPGFVRRLGYGIARRDYEFQGGWAYGSHQYCIDSTAELFGPLFPGSEVLVLPAIFLRDESLTDPVGWVRRYVTKYGRRGEEEPG